MLVKASGDAKTHRVFSIKSKSLGEPEVPHSEVLHVVS